MQSKPKKKRKQADDGLAPKVVKRIKELIPGVIVWRNSLGGTLVGGKHLVPNSRAGTPDVEGIMPDGRYFCFECKPSTWKFPKSEPKTPWSPTNSTWKTWVRANCQKEWLDTTRSMGCMASFVQSLQELEDCVSAYISSKDNARTTASEATDGPDAPSHDDSVSLVASW